MTESLTAALIRAAHDSMNALRPDVENLRYNPTGILFDFRGSTYYTPETNDTPIILESNGMRSWCLRQLLNGHATLL